MNKSEQEDKTLEVGTGIEGQDMLDSLLWSNANVWRLFSYMMLKASRKKCGTMVGYKPFCLFPGNLIFSRIEASKSTGLSTKDIRSSEKCLESMGEISIVTIDRIRVVHILKWQEYQ